MILENLKNGGFIMGRMISWSKSDYRINNPKNVCVFNANIITKEGKVWHGDLDITKDGEKLKEIAEQEGVIIYVLREMDCRFGNEDDDFTKLVEKSVWDTTQSIPYND